MAQENPERQFVRFTDNTRCEIRARFAIGGRASQDGSRLPRAKTG
jgi:hypothetical protein